MRLHYDLLGGNKITSGIILYMLSVFKKESTGEKIEKDPGGKY